MSAWALPKAAVIGGLEYQINADYRDILDILSYLSDETKNEYIRWRIALGLFYEGEIPLEHETEAIKYLSDFIDYGIKEDRPSPKLMDWEQDAQMIVADVNKVAGKEIRSEKFVHWWTFLAYFNAIGEGQLSTVVSIRNKRRKGQNLEKWEQEYYRENRKKVDFQQPETPEKAAAKAYFDKWL